MGRPTIVVLGGGVGGLVVTSSLMKKLGRKAKITLIERKKNFQFPPSYPWLMLGMRKPDQVQKSLEPLKRGVDVVNEEVVSINLGDMSVATKRTTFAYDYLVIALGAEYAPESIPGFSEYAHHIYDLDSALSSRHAIENFTGGDVAVGVSRTPFKCPAAPYETALLLDHYFRGKGLKGKFRIRFFSPEGLPLPSAGPEIGSGTRQFMESRGIEFKFKAKLTEIKPNEARFEDGTSVPFNLLLGVPPHRAPKPVTDAGLTDQSGWIPVEPNIMKTKHESVYAVGDVASVPTPSGYVPLLPKAGVFAHGQAEVVAHNISVDINGTGTKREFDGAGSCFLMTGGEQAAFVKGNWYAKPHPDIKFQQPSQALYYERVLFEKYWMHHWFQRSRLTGILDAPMDWLHHSLQH